MIGGSRRSDEITGGVKEAGRNDRGIKEVLRDDWGSRRPDEMTGVSGSKRGPRYRRLLSSIRTSERTVHSPLHPLRFPEDEVGVSPTCLNGVGGPFPGHTLLRCPVDEKLHRLPHEQPHPLLHLLQHELHYEEVHQVVHPGYWDAPSLRPEWSSTPTRTTTSPESLVSSRPSNLSSISLALVGPFLLLSVDCLLPLEYPSFTSHARKIRVRPDPRHEGQNVWLRV